MRHLSWGRVHGRRWLRATAVLCALAMALAAFPFVLRWWVDQRYKRLIYGIEDAPPRPVAIVFGAGITRDGQPMPALADRVWTAAQLYRAGKVHKLLMSGDNRFIEYNEPEAMRHAERALAQGVPDEDIIPEGCIVLDTFGRSAHLLPGGVHL